MRDTQNFWSACESLPGLAAVEFEWKARAGADYNLWKPFLRPRQESASSIPCKSEHPCGCRHRVVDHGNGRIVAVCRCEPSACESFAVIREDLTVYELYLGRLSATIAKALSLQSMRSTIPGIRKTELIGIDSPTKGFDFPVYLTYQYDPEDFRQVLLTLKATTGNPFILITPTDTWYQADCRTLMDSSGSLFLTIPDILSPMDTGKIRVNPTAADLLKRFHERILPNNNRASMKVFFETPSNATWSDVYIAFRSSHTVTISVKSQHGDYSYTNMGMADGRTGDPNMQWELLYAFAQRRGILDWDHPDANKKNKKRKEMLSQSLRDFFRIDNEPFFYDKETKGWTALFHIEPE